MGQFCDSDKGADRRNGGPTATTVLATNFGQMG